MAKISIKHVYFVGNLFLLSSTTNHASTPRILAGCLFTAAGLTAIGQADELNILDDISEYCNVSKEDIECVLSASTLAFGISFLPIDSNTGKSLRQWSFRLPILASIAAVTSCPGFKNIMKKIPGLGTYLGACSRETCEGSCNKCKIRMVLTTYTLWHSLASRPVTWIETSRLGTYLF